MADTSTPKPHDGGPQGNAHGRVLLDEKALRDALDRITAGISQRNADASRLALVGLPTRGVTLAQRIASQLREKTGIEVPVGQIDITFHRDDLEWRRPIPHVTSIPFDITGRTLVLVDDVLFSGRSVRAALDALIDHGRPESIQLVALIDRGHRRLPIAADYVGATVKTEYVDNVAVKVKEVDGVDAVEVLR